MSAFYSKFLASKHGRRRLLIWISTFEGERRMPSFPPVNIDDPKLMPMFISREGRHSICAIVITMKPTVHKLILRLASITHNYKIIFQTPPVLFYHQ